MAYNLESLVKILQEILHPDDHGLPWILHPTKTLLVQSLLAKASFLIQCFDNFPLETGDEVRRLESRIRDATYHAENIIQSHLADQLLLKRKGERIMISPPDLLQVIEEHEFERIVDEMATIIDGRVARSASSSHLISRNEDLNPTKLVVGMDKDLLQLKDWLTSDQSKLEVMPIVGMGGIGKTTLARTLYDDLLVVSHFDARAWVVISQSYSVREILLGLLKCVIQEPTDEMMRENNGDLGSRLHKNLWGRRYLIVLDDMWSFEAWDDLKMFFPDDKNRSRILVTTRELSVATYASSHELHHKMNFLSDVESWNLLCQKVFAEENFPSELEVVGKNIVTSCRGLPLSIHVVSGVLSRLETTQDAWSQVANDVHSSMANNDEQFLKILSLSYNHLPNYLKPCFLYMSAFAEDQEVQASELIMLWIAEGFLKPILGKSLEDAAEIYLEELVQRNLFIVCAPETKWKVKRYTMHDSLRHFCIKKAQEEKFLHVVMDDICDLNPQEALHLRRLSAPKYQIGCIAKSQGLANVTHSVLLSQFDGGFHHRHHCDHPAFHYISRLKLVKVLGVAIESLQEFSKILENLVNLRYLATYNNLNLFPSLARQRHLQTLIYYGTTYTGKVQELFQSTQLRHVKLKGNGFLFCDRFEGESIAFQENLHTLFTVIIDKRFPKMLKAIPNIKNLGICSVDTLSHSSTIDLRCLTKLEILKCTYHAYAVPNSKAPSVLPYLIFPLFLKKLSLRKYRIPFCCMVTIGALPTLQILKLQSCEFEAQTWEPNEGEFSQLRHLVFEDLNLVKWVACQVTFPRLEHLIIRNCIKLEAVPSEIGDIPTLEKIEVLGLSNDSALKSVREIRDEQLEFGNNTLQIHIDPSKFSTRGVWDKLWFPKKKL